MYCLKCKKTFEIPMGMLIMDYEGGCPYCQKGVAMVKTLVKMRESLDELMEEAKMDSSPGLADAIDHLAIACEHIEGLLPLEVVEGLKK